MNTDQPFAQSSPAVAGPTNPHVLWRQIFGFVFWVSLLTLPAGGLAGLLLFGLLGGVTFVDAWRSGIYKRPDSKSFVNISPMGWGVAMAALFVVAYPAYLLSRNKLRTIHAGNGFFVATIVLGVPMIGLLGLTIFALANK
jgi:hypothetical protein